MFLGSVERGETDIMLLPKRPAWFGKQNCNSKHLHWKFLDLWTLFVVFLCHWHNNSFCRTLVHMCFSHSTEERKSSVCRNVFFGVSIVDGGQIPDIWHRNCHVQSSESGSVNLYLRIFSYFWRFAKVINYCDVKINRVKILHAKFGHRVFLLGFQCKKNVIIAVTTYNADPSGRAV